MSATMRDLDGAAAALSACEEDEYRKHMVGMEVNKQPDERCFDKDALSKRLTEKFAMIEKLWHEDTEEGAGEASPVNSTSHENIDIDVIGDAMRKRLEEKFRVMQLQQEADVDGVATKKLLTFTGSNATKFRKDRKALAYSSLRTKNSRGAWILEEEEEPKAAMSAICE
jgi:hypothetical protein